ncbi:nuclear transport factor 2 family protein [Rhodopseudomonas palustris]|uniref:Nuclear transport factor 2 family protein n=1 Tax=Rhodopseudomonas palustris TaxID=1076 RepID=A0A323UC79_RHOPL|nr:nuclear transport factor 2 family protein [Rhodopseudomonas palustris]PZA10344.1 nuclear transport factor 2 family protein [Rhodopseudomonas palustris]
MTNIASALAPGAQRTLAVWHEAFVGLNGDRMRALIADDVVLHSPIVQSPIHGQDGTVLVLTTVAEIFRRFQYRRTYVGSPLEAALEFTAAIDGWELKGVDLMRFNEDGRIAEFEVMIRPLRALSALGEEIGRRIGPRLMQIKRTGASGPLTKDS